MKALALCLMAGLYANAQTHFQISPEVITQCVAGILGRAQLSWTTGDAGPVQVRVGSADGIPMTGWEPAKGSAETGNWVSDAMLFVLVDSAGRELARVTAHVACSVILTTGSYFPLTVGNEWVFRSNSRSATSSYATWEVTRKEIVQGQAWFAVRRFSAGDPGAGSEILMRGDELGRVYQLGVDGREQLWLDPTDPPDPGAVLKIKQRGPYSFALGTFADSVTYQKIEPLLFETGTLVKGLGLTASRVDMLSGSSGGFLSSLDLIQARVDGAVRSIAPVVSLGVAVESTDLDVTGRKVTNCAIPCYFVACGLVPGADPPGTYKPCFQIRIDATGLSGMLELDFLDAGNNALLHVENSPAGYRQLPLYGKPNETYAAGTYRVRARIGEAEAVVPVRVH
jgi:hypothetical protein